MQRRVFVASGLAAVGSALVAGTDAVAAASDAPYVDLRLAPYNVVPDDATKGASNTAGINAAIVAHSGTHACLVLPSGLVYVDQANATDNWSILFGQGIADLKLAGQGMFATTIVQQGPGDFGDWAAIRLAGAERIELADFGVMQGTIDNPDPGQQMHLIVVTDGSTSGSKDVYGHDLYFGKALGDQLRFLGATNPISNVHFTRLLMHGAGVVNAASGRTGARSGIAFQRGFSNVEVDHFYIDGVQNSPIDFEPSGPTTITIDHAHVHHGTLDNSLGHTSVAMSIGGVSHGARLRHARFHDLVVIGGRVVVVSTDDLQIRGLTVLSSAAFPNDAAGGLLTVRQVNNDLELIDVHAERTGTSAPGNVLDIENSGNATTVEGGLFVAGVTGYPIAVDGSSNLRIRGAQIRYEGGSPAGKSGILVNAVVGNADDVQIDDVRITSTTGKLRSAVQLGSRQTRSLQNVRVTNVDSAGYAATGVYMSVGSTSTFDSSPYLSAIDNGADATWKQVDQNDNPVTTVYPMIGGNAGGPASYCGVTDPETKVAAVQGSWYVRQNGDSSTVWIKTSGTGATGWSQLAVP